MKQDTTISNQWSDVGRTPASLKRKTARAFTLVEVALALGVMSVGIIAILGLLPSALQSARNAADNTVTATIVQDLFSTLRAQPFTTASLSSLGGSSFQLNNPANTGTLNFDQAGNVTNTSGSYLSYYRVVVTSASQAPFAKANVQATVFWPAWSSSHPPLNTNS